MNTSPILAAAAPSSLSTLGNASIAASGDAPDFHELLQQMSANVNSQGTPAADTKTDTSPVQSSSTGTLTNTASSSDVTTELSDFSPSFDTNVFTKQGDVTDIHPSSFGSKASRSAAKHVNTKSAEKETSTKDSSSNNKDSSVVSPLAPFAIPTPVETQVAAVQETSTLSSLQTDAPQDTTVGLNRFAAFISHSVATAGHVNNLSQATSTKSESGSMTDGVSSTVTASASLTAVSQPSGLDINQSAAATTQSTLASDVDETLGVAANSGATKHKVSNAGPVASSTNQTAPANAAAAAPNASVVPTASSSLQTDIPPTPSAAAPVVQTNNLAQPTAPEIIAALISGQTPRATAAPTATSTSATGDSKAKSQPAIPSEKNTQAVAPTKMDDAATSTPIASQNAIPQFTGAQATFVAANTADSQTAVRSNASSAIGRAGSRSRQHSASLSNPTSSLSDKDASSPASERSSTISPLAALTTNPTQSSVLQQTITPDATHAAQSAAQPSPQVAAAVLAQSTPQPSAHATAPTQHQMQSNPIPDPPRMVDSGHLRVGQNSSELKISVQLPEVGKVEVRAVTSHDVTTAHITALRHDALPALSAERANLEQVLKSRDVILGSLNSNSQGQSDGQQRQQNFQSSARPFGGTSSNAAAVTTSTTAEASSNGILPDYSSISVRA